MEVVIRVKTPHFLRKCTASLVFAAYQPDDCTPSGRTDMNSFGWYTAKTLEMLRHFSIVCLANIVVRCLTNSKLDFLGDFLIVVKDAEIAIKIISLGN